MAKRKYRKYTLKQKVSALTLLHKNGGDIRNTAKTLGITIKAIRSWSEGLGDEFILEKSTLQEDRMFKVEVENSEIKHSEKKKDFIDSLFEVKNKIIAQMEKITSQQDDIKKLADALKILDDLENGGDGEEGGGSKNILNIIEKQMIISNEKIKKL